MRILITLFIILLLAASSQAQIVDEYTSRHDTPGGGTFSISSEPRYYQEDGEWQHIDTTLQPDTAGGDYGATKMKNNVGFKKRPSDNDLFTVTIGAHTLSVIPKRVGYTSPEGEEGIGVPTNQLATTNGSTIIYDDYFWGINVNYTVSSTHIEKKILIPSFSSIPPIPEDLYPPMCYPECLDPGIHGYIDYQLKSTLDIVTEHGVWDESSTVTTEEEIQLSDNGNVVYTVLPGYVLMNLSARATTPYELRKAKGKLWLRQLIPYIALAYEESFPLLIDPTVEIDNSTQDNSYGDNDHTCSPDANCCSFLPGGVCTELIQPSPTCTDLSDGDYPLLINDKACGGCTGPRPGCCASTGNYKTYNIRAYNYSGIITEDYNQVTVNDAQMQVTVDSGGGDIRARHHDTDAYWPDCSSLHTLDSDPQPAIHTWAGTVHNFTMTNHTQASLRNNDDTMYALFDTTTNSNPARNKIISSILFVDYTYNSCRAPFAGNWNTACNCTIEEDFDVPGDMTITGNSAGITQNSTLTFTGSNQYIYVNSQCTWTITDGGIN